MRIKGSAGSSSQELKSWMCTVKLPSGRRSHAGDTCFLQKGPSRNDISIFWPFTKPTYLPSGVMLPFGAPLLIFLPPPTKNYCLQKTNKKRSPLFFGFSYRLFVAPGALSTPNIFRVDRTLSLSRYGPFCCLVERFLV